MNYTVYNTTTGQVLRWGACPEADIQLQAVFEGEAVVEGVFEEHQFWWNGTEMVARPSPYAELDIQTGAWSDRLDEPKALKKAAIEKERDRRINAPVLQYDGINLDADSRAIENVKSKLAEANSRLATNDPFPPDELVWRDADNQMHTFADTRTYKVWLDGFAIALGTRGTAAYAWSWQRKAVLDAASTVAEVDSIDLSEST